MSSTATRDALVRAGVELLEEHGAEGLGLRAIARRANVSHGAPRHWFPSHRTLLSAIAATGLADLRNAMERAAGDGPDPHSPDIQRNDPLLAVATAYVVFAIDRPAMFALMFRHDLLEGGGANLRGTSIPLLRWVLDQPGSDVLNEQAAVSLWCSVHGIATLTMHGALGVVAPGTEAEQLLSDAVSVARHHRGD